MGRSFPAGLACVCLLACTLWASPVAAEPSEIPANFAANYNETETPRSTGTAGAMRALGGGVDGIFLNPANLGLVRLYHIDALVQVTPEAGRHMYGGAIVDSTRRFSGGVSVVGGFQDPDGVDRSSLDVRLALAFAVSPQFHIGLGGRYIGLDQEGLGPLGDSRASGGLRDPEDPPLGRDALVRTFTFDAGATIRATDELHISFAGTNLSYPNNGILPTTVGGGIGYGSEDFSIEVDGVADFNSWLEINPRVMAGGEYLIAGRVPVRLGYRFDLLAGSELDPSHQLSGGLGYTEPRFGIQAGVRRTLVGPSATTITAGLSFHLEALGVPIEQD